MASEDRQRAQQHGPRVAPVGGAPRRLGQQVQADADRHPDDRLGRHRGRRVGARRLRAELVLGDDHVDVLQRGEQEQPDDRHPAVAEQAAQRAHLAAVDAHRADAPVQDDLERDGDDHEGQRRAEHRAGHAEADARRGRARRRAARAPSSDDRRADRRRRPAAPAARRAAATAASTARRPAGSPPRPTAPRRRRSPPRSACAGGSTQRSRRRARRAAAGSSDAASRAASRGGRGGRAPPRARPPSAPTGRRRAGSGRRRSSAASVP